VWCAYHKYHIKKYQKDKKGFKDKDLYTNLFGFRSKNGTKKKETYFLRVVIICQLSYRTPKTTISFEQECQQLTPH